MTIAYWMVLVAAIMPIVLAGISKAGGERFNNRAPRDWLAQQEGWRQRANWAQQNSYEAFPPFAAAVIIAHQLDAGQATIDTLALAFIGFRIAYGICYIGNWHALRSLMWIAGFLCVIGLFITAA
jgi:uncharacterized MAPEG superfamily protein